MELLNVSTYVLLLTYQSGRRVLISAMEERVNDPRNSKRSIKLNEADNRSSLTPHI